MDLKYNIGNNNWLKTKHKQNLLLRNQTNLNLTRGNKNWGMITRSQIVKSGEIVKFYICLTLVIRICPFLIWPCYLFDPKSCHIHLFACVNPSKPTNGSSWFYVKDFKLWNKYTHTVKTLINESNSNKQQGILPSSYHPELIFINILQWGQHPWNNFLSCILALHATQAASKMLLLPRTMGSWAEFLSSW